MIFLVELHRRFLCGNAFCKISTTFTWYPSNEIPRFKSWFGADCAPDSLSSTRYGRYVRLGDGDDNSSVVAYLAFQRVTMAKYDVKRGKTSTTHHKYASTTPRPPLAFGPLISSFSCF
jgi:hypothetical protein